MMMMGVDDASMTDRQALRGFLDLERHLWFVMVK